MRILLDLANKTPLQVEKSPAIGDISGINGKFALEVPAGSVPVNTSTTVVPVTGTDLSSLIFDELLAAYPNYNHVLFNTFLTASDIVKLDLTATLDNTSNLLLPPPFTGSFATRAQVGRGAGSQIGSAPGSVAILRANEATTPPRPGLLITDLVDISADVGAQGTNSFLVYWKIYRVSTSHDINSVFGGTVGLNTPAIRAIEEIDQETAGFVVGLSVDDGGSFFEVPHLRPVSLCVSGTEVRLAFANTSSTDQFYLASYAVLY